MKAFALKEELVDVDQRLCGGAAREEPGIGGGGRLVPERMDSVSLLPSVMPPHEDEWELVLPVRVLRVEPGREEVRERMNWLLGPGEAGSELISRSRTDGARIEEKTCSPT